MAFEGDILDRDLYNLLHDNVRHVLDLQGIEKFQNNQWELIARSSQQNYDF